MYIVQQTYKDLDGVERTETLHFRFSESEMADLQFSEAGGFANVLIKIFESQDRTAMMAMFKKFILDAYGEKDPEARAFIKERNGKRLSEDFKQTEVFNQYYMRMLNDTDEAIRFFNNVFPQELMQKAKVAISNDQKITDNPTTQKMIDMVNARIKDSGNS